MICSNGALYQGRMLGRMGREWMCSLVHCLGAVARKGGCGGIENGIRDNYIVCRWFLALIWYWIYMYTLHCATLQQQSTTFAEAIATNHPSSRSSPLQVDSHLPTGMSSTLRNSDGSATPEPTQSRRRAHAEHTQHTSLPK